MDNRRKELSNYRLHQAAESLEAAKNCYDNGFYKNSINRSYYSAFYSIKAVLAYGTIDFKRHKEVIGYFNKEYVATKVFPRELGRRSVCRIICNDLHRLFYTPLFRISVFFKILHVLYIWNIFSAPRYIFSHNFSRTSGYNCILRKLLIHKTA